MSVAMKTWTDSLEQAAVEVAALALGFEGAEVVAREVPPPEGVAGAYLPLFGGNGEALYVGWLATDAASHALARGLLGLGADEAVAPGDVADAMGEAVNILAGGLKRRMISWVHPLALGLPMYAAAPITPLHAATFACELRCGEVSSHVLLVRGSGPSPQR